MNTSEREGPQKKPHKKRGTRWLFFWENILLPLNLVMGVGWLTIDFQSVSLLMVLLIAATIVGLKVRSLWGWYLNFILLVAVILSYPFYLYGQKLGDYELYKQAHDVLVKNGERDPRESVLPPPEFAAEDFFLPFGIAAVIIFLPSAIYFEKRKYLFDGSVPPSASTAPETEPQSIVSAHDIEVQPHEVQQARVKHARRFPIIATLAVLWLGIVVIVIMCLCPPWVEITRLPSSNIKGTDPTSYAFLWSPPETGSRLVGIAVDYSRLMLQIFAVALITGSLLFTLRSCQSKGRSSEP